MDYWQTGWTSINDMTPEIEADMDRKNYNHAALWGYAEEYRREGQERMARLERDSKRP